MTESNTFCPVPLEQQPVNEYQELAQSWFFQWVTLPKWQFVRKLAWVGFWSLFVCCPIASASFSPETAFFPFLLSSLFGASLFVGFFLIRLFLGWNYIADRLKKTKIVYEESSWYDGQVWEKPLEFYRRDQLILQYQVEPLLKRLKKTFVSLISVMALLVLTFGVVI